MKSRAIQKYVTRVLVYTGIFILFIITMDYIFNGTIVEYLYDRLPSYWYRLVNENRTFVAFFVYAVGLVIISVIYVLRLGKLLRIASDSLYEQNPSIFGTDCPDELLGFSRKLKDFKHELEENERARSLAEQQKNDLIVYLAHDLKTPLTSVIGYLSLLQETQDLPVEIRAKYVGIASDKAYRLEQLINEFFDITRLNLSTIKTQKAKVNLTILLVQILNEFFPVFEEKHLTVETDIASEIILWADADKMARVFDNLFRNAANYSFAGTKIECVARKTEHQAIVSIKNVGENIPEEKLAHIFEKFYRVDDSRGTATGGSGLGLAIAKQIVELHDGEISVLSEGGITQFTVTLPL